MPDRSNNSDSLFHELRRQAEALLREREVDTSGYPEGILQLVQELQVHQTELELQNEELQNAQQEISKLRHKYEALYEFAPCGYLALSPKGIITFCNLRGGALLGMERGDLRTMALSGFVAQDSQNDYFSAISQARQSGEQQTTELELIRQDGESVWVQADIQPDWSEDDSLEQWRITLTDITERKQMEGTLRENEQKYRSLFENRRDAILLADTERNIFDCNSAFESLFGYSLQEIKGRKTSFVYEDEQEYQMLGNALGETFNNSSFFMTVNYKKKNGEVFPGETGVYYLKDRVGNVIGFIGVIRDITDRKQAEEELRKREQHLQAILQATPDPLVVYDSVGHPQYINPAFTQVFGWNFEELQGQRVPFVPEDQKERTLAKIREIYTTGVPTIFDTKRLTKSNRLLDIRISAAIIQSSLQEHYGLVVILTDITERKQIEEALRQSESYYRTIFETSGSAMLIVEEDTTITLVNSNFEELSGYSRQEIEGKKSWNDFVHSVDVARRRQNQYSPHYSAIDAPLQYEIRLITRHSEIREVFLTLDRIPGTNQSIISCIDITQRKQMEEKLKEMSIYDSLTGLYNRNFFEEEMQRLSDGRYSPLGIVVCDLDGLKFVNDTLGHQSGDYLLRHTADILRRNFRSSDIIARIGGDEFAILLPEVDSEIIERRKQRLRQAIQEYNRTEQELPLSLSMGHALGEGETADTQALFREADNRMYREKIQREGSARSAILHALTVSMEARDFNTEDHSDRLQELAASLARSLNLSQDVVNDLYLLARFHDLGKVGIPDHILFKSGPLTEEEWQQMRQHCEIGHRIASSVPDLEPVADYILKHHEWWDGRGYPLGLSGQDIPLLCRILGIADAYDAMTSDRPYRKAMTHEEAIAELRRCAGTQFDPELVKRFVQILEQDEG